MKAVLHVAPVAGETTWSFLHRVAAAYRLQTTDLMAWWRWVTPARYSGRADGEVLLDAVAQAQLAGWCRVPAAHLARALPSWTAGPDALAGRSQDGRGWARWRMGPSAWGPVVFGCRLCAARRGAGDGRVWVYRAPWRRLCARHGRWLLPVGEGHPWEFTDVAGLVQELGRAQRRWARVERAAQAAGAAQGEVFAMARAVVCGWWDREEVWAQESVWGPRLEQVAAATRTRGGDPAGWGDAQWRLLARDAVIFPEVVVVAGALLDPRLQELAAGHADALLRDRGAAGRFTAALGERLARPWLAEVEAAAAAGPLARWVSAMLRQRRRPAGAPPLRGWQGVWWVRGPHRPLDVAAGLRLLAESLDTKASGEASGGDGDGGAAGHAAGARGGARGQEAVPRRAWRGRGLTRWHAQLFAEGLDHARRHAQRHGHLALAHTGRGVVEGFDLGRWLAKRRADAACLTAEQTAQLTELDAWWNPPWPVGWQRAWYRARAYTDAHGPVHGGDNLSGLPRWLELWLRRQITRYGQLHQDQQRLLAELGLTSGEVERFNAWPGRRRPAGDAFAIARDYAARHGHLAVPGPGCTAPDGFALGDWLTAARRRQRTAGRPTRLGQRLSAVDAWWNPPWPIAWQQMWWAARHHLTGLPDGLTWWPGAPNADHAGAWLTRQAARRLLLRPGQQQLIDELLPAGGRGSRTTPGRCCSRC
ncbi:helicase associated domain-containing protein [Streptomyces sp. MK7]|uniref:helicase associated domain-containing protein n=1 Tax=Streptomyces sp. MK7 TaxID=3067635 RepID=UPI002931042C|nr:helicase associated domain-containing protein [Streptomyces sp. MK7]